MLLIWHNQLPVRFLRGTVFVASPLPSDTVGGLGRGAALHIRKQRSQRLGPRQKLE